MCDPVSITLAAGAAFGAYGQIKSGQENKRAAFAAADQSDEQSLDAIVRGADEETRYRREIGQLASSQRTAFGARNVTTTGSALDLLSDTAYFGEMDAQQIRTNARRESQYYRDSATEMRRSGRASQRNSYFSAGASLLTGGAQAYGAWKRPAGGY